jgi:imidazolonepropionase-like amidohydrolase
MRTPFLGLLVALGLAASLHGLVGIAGAPAKLSNWVDQIGSIEKGKYADVIAVAGNPLTDVSEMRRVRFVMKGGYVVKNELTAR